MVHAERVSHMILVGGPHFSTLQPGADVQHWQTQSNNMRKRDRQLGSADDARAILRSSYPQFSDEAIEHAIQFNTRTNATGNLEWKYDPVWVADGLRHALDSLSEYAARIRCPILILRAT